MTTNAVDASPTGGSQRLDKWLWYARVVKTRTLAAALVVNGKVRVNKARVDKPSQSVRAGDVITVAVHSKVRVLRVVAPGERRGAPAAARTLFEDLAPPSAATGDQGGTVSASDPQREPGAGRPTKRDRRDLERITGKWR